MSEYPQDIIKAADEVCIAMNIPSTVDNCIQIMAALVAERERHQCQPIETAPRTGERILIKTVTFGWNSDICQNVATGDKWVEARWGKDLSGRETWLEWCGDEKTYTTDSLTPTLWMPLPSPPTTKEE